MAKEDFIEPRDGDLDGQEEVFITNFPTHAAALGIDVAEVTDVTTILTNHRTSYATMLSKKAASKAAVAENNLKKKDAISEFRRIAKKIKASTGYTEAIGDDLRIIGPEVVPPPLEEMKPTLKAEVSGNAVIIKFDKQGMEGVKIYCKRGSEDSFSFLEKDVESPYTDERPKLDPATPEERNYYAFYIEHDDEVGLQSDIVTVVVP